jgi:osmotically-inducible protein OsmY
MKFTRRNRAMTKSSRVLIVLILSPYLIWSMGGSSEASDAHEKESVVEKPTSSGTSQPPVASDGQPTSPKPAPETKPQLPVAPAPKGDTSTEHKEVAPEKPGAGSSQVPVGSDSQPTAPKPAPEAKPHQPATPAPAPKGEASTEHKDVAPEKSGSDSQSTTPKPAPEAKPQPPAVPAPKSDASTEHKEVAPKKPASDSQSTTPKPTPEAKPPVAPLPKSDASTEHKEVVPKKPASDSQSTAPKPVPEVKPQLPAAPTMKADLPPDHEVKDKEPALKKALGSLILSVKLALMGDSRLFHYEIEVEDDQQTITLSGRVSTEEEKAVAKEVAQKVHGVKDVVNKLTVEKDLAKTLMKKQDETLTSLVKERFSKSATLKAANFDVKTEEGIVLINGTVRFQVIALEAAEAARQVPGVRAVNTEKVRLEGES